MSKAPEVLTFDHAQVLPPLGFRFPARMTALALSDGSVALISPVPITEEMAGQIARLGEVRFLVAPNLLHHLYLAAAIERYPAAQVLAPPGLRHKRVDLRIDHTLDEPLPDALRTSVDVVRIEGAPSVDEFAFFHRATGTLVVTDLVFNVTQPDGFVANVVLFLVGCHGRLASSRAWRLFVKDRALAAASVERLLALPFETLVMAHGDVVRTGAHARLASALAWIPTSRPALVASF